MHAKHEISFWRGRNYEEHTGESLSLEMMMSGDNGPEEARFQTDGETMRVGLAINMRSSRFGALRRPVGAGTRKLATVLPISGVASGKAP